MTAPTDLPGKFSFAASRSVCSSWFYLPFHLSGNEGELALKMCAGLASTATSGTNSASSYARVGLRRRQLCLPLQLPLVTNSSSYERAL